MGCDRNSWGYHSDDGCLFDCSEIEEPYGPEFKSGDIIRCFLNFRNSTVFYTKNGVNLGIAFRDLENSVEDPYYPCIGVSSKGRSISIEANFGNKKFKYTAIADNDIDDDRVKEEWIKAFKRCDNKDVIENFVETLNSFEINPNDKLRYSAKANFVMGKYEEALANLKDLLEIEHNNAFALRYRGETYFILNEYEKSNVDLTKLLEANIRRDFLIEAQTDFIFMKAFFTAELRLLEKEENLEEEDEYTSEKELAESIGESLAKLEAAKAKTVNTLDIL
ncbi:concanavalin A-like lectin/glucanase domain-containing protein [Gigaspora rosea]|uniref:Concanavalin A-like lectin/glucanase domain-containing protein n=1 Tax=Gigaspora rosea TaxID=44941 RepID=A0A397V8V4_9GLOM|nr:concanavalin A-like lectin/glucanase domain-containing protein [Gigaspora rosea]